jgi:hypothetical protein
MDIRNDRRLQLGLVGVGALVVIVGLVNSASAKAPSLAVRYGKGFRSRLGDIQILPFIMEVSGTIGVNPAKLYAVLKQESDGRLISRLGYIYIRFEPHVFARWTAQTAPKMNSKPSAAQIAEHGTVVLLPGMSAATSDEGRKRLRGQPAEGQVQEWDAFQKAWNIDRESAARSISMGAGQIMGMNYALLGYNSAVDMFRDFMYRPIAQLEGFVKFISSGQTASLREMLEALRIGDYPTFVRVYNGAPIGSANNDRYVRGMIQSELDFIEGDIALG